jgi:NADH-quinone oxidoreductase subunit F
MHMSTCDTQTRYQMTALTTADGVVLRIAGDRDGSLATAADAADCRVARVGPTGVPTVEPLVTITRDGRTAAFARCSEERVADLAARLPDTVDSVAGEADATTDHDATTTRLPASVVPGLDAGARHVLGGCGWRRPTNVADHEAAGGFAGSDAETVLAAGDELRGRGWGDWSHDEFLRGTWETARDGEEDAAVVVNAHGTPADTLLLAGAPFEVLDGAQSLAAAVSADRVVVYAAAEDAGAVETAREAVAAYPDPDVPAEVVAGPPEYRAAEPTMAIEAIEGAHRLEARLRPPGPEESGLFGRPTLVHTARTFAHLAVTLREGTPPGTRAVTVVDDADREATVELPESATVADAVSAVAPSGEPKAACVGGRFGGVTADLDTALDPVALSDADLGTEGTVELLADDRCLVEFVGRRARFAADENCGRCVPCREGTTQLTNLLRDVYDGDFDREGIEELVRVMSSSSICAFGVDAGRPVRTALDEFTAEFETHADGRCPTGSCSQTPEVR